MIQLGDRDVNQYTKYHVKFYLLYPTGMEKRGSVMESACVRDSFPEELAVELSCRGGIGDTKCRKCEGAVLAKVFSGRELKWLSWLKFRRSELGD